MNNLFRKLKVSLPLLILAAGMTSCSDWTEIKSAYDPDELYPGFEVDEEYYENLRAYKATMFDRKLAWGWFGGWVGSGANLQRTLEGLPDSLDIVSLWGNAWVEGTEAQKRDLERVQKVKGTRVITCDLMGNFYFKDFTPDDVPEDEILDWWGWEGDLGYDYPSLNWEVPTPKQEEVIRKFARCVAERVIEYGLDGYDLDWEDVWTRGSCASYPERILVYIDELSKYFGPKSGTDRLLVVDGYIDRLYPKLAPYFDLFVIQSYGATSNTVLDGVNTSNRYKTSYENFKDYFTPEEFAEKVVMTENYEQARYVTGGVTFTLPSGERTNSLQGMALWNPTYNGEQLERSGGFGSFHIEYEYSTPADNGYTGFYRWTRQAIQAANPAKPKGND